jgi:hypothetical protein
MATIAWYAQGVRVLDISGLTRFKGSETAVGFGDGVGIKEVGNYVLPDSDTWSFKTNRIRRDGSFFGYGNDLVRGFDVYKFTGRTVGDVPPLRPQDLRTASQDSLSGNVAGSLAILAPAMVLAAVARRRATRRNASGTRWD